MERFCFHQVTLNLLNSICSVTYFTSEHKKNNLSITTQKVINATIHI